MLSSIHRVATRLSGTKWLATTTRGMASDSATFDLTGSFETYNLDSAPNNTVEATRDDLMQKFKTMYTMRRMEITCDNEYKAKNIRGFCHLYDGQEAVAMGIQSALTKEDSWITSYRCHCTALLRGGTVSSVVGELFARANGYSKGKGGSMHFYNKEHNFYGGHGIVGAQVPVGTGLAFANKYHAAPGEPMNVAIACYGDGAANQGQIWESANMASLWKLPMIFCIENNQYGMGTSIDRHSSHSDYFQMGNHIPGIRIDGMNVLAVQEGMRFVRDFTSNGNGPMYVEMMTYRYHGHSMSDPGTTYRNREEIAFTRSTRDPLEFVKKTMVDAGFADAEEIKSVEKQIRKEVQAEVLKAKEWPYPEKETMFKDIFTKDGSRDSQEYPPFIRMPDYENSFYAPN
jgi:pyruvate dehydrogenase E1 component alpha subunit